MMHQAADSRAWNLLPGRLGIAQERLARKRLITLQAGDFGLAGAISIERGAAVCAKVPCSGSDGPFHSAAVAGRQPNAASCRPRRGSKMGAACQAHANPEEFTMVRIEAFQPADFAAIVGFVEAIQEHERIHVPDLKSGWEIGTPYAELLLLSVAERNGCMLIARAETRTIGFACAWVEEDEDLLVCDAARAHAYISDIFVDHDWRRRGVASLLLDAVETAMRERGCSRIRVCSKAANRLAVACYEMRGYRPYEIIFSKQLNGQT
jgi:ribosomal protein S18 acetylase RimI-like enzyme